MHYDVFNGDADGIIALLQLRLNEPKVSKFITGVKRDIKLLKQVVAQDDVTSVTTLDISMEKNSSELEQLLERNIPVFYCDHHRSGDIPRLLPPHFPFSLFYSTATFFPSSYLRYILKPSTLSGLLYTIII